MTIKEFDLSGLSVCFIIPCYTGVVPIETAIALAQTVDKLRSMGLKVAMVYERSASLVDVTRNRLAKKFMDVGYQKAFWIDNDIVFTEEDVLRLLAFSTQYKVIGCTYPARDDKPKFFVNMYDKVEPWKLNPDGLLRANAFGFGFVVVDRSVFEVMETELPTYTMDGEYVQYFKTGIDSNGRYQGEDVHFMMTYVDKFGGEVYIDPWTDVQHVGTKHYNYKFSEYIRAKHNE